ncbi:hypothetical protein ACFOWM_13875 [Ferruginibacter yonginensis]|uniref:Uncharacterized protein n=1 Tax=Ferruginibacter yonginensis TaxID=1310416 RepID=A0ABV8QY16_9BACT
MNRLLGYIFICIGLLTLFGLVNYEGTAIPVKEIWITLSILLISAGLFFLVKYKLINHNTHQNNSNFDRFLEIEELKKIGDKIKITLENSEIKSRNFYQEIINEAIPNKIEILDSVYDSNRNYKTQEIIQTYIVFYKEYNGKTYKYISKATIQNISRVKNLFERQKGFNLFIDPNNPTRYYFEFP